VASTVAAQPRPARDGSTDLKKQLIDIQAKQIQLRIRLEEIDQALKPEAIERELAGIGSVHPEQLRENRRKLLTIERDGLRRQLDLLEDLRGPIEAAIGNDEQASTYVGDERPITAKPSPHLTVTLKNLPGTGFSFEKVLGGFAITVPIAAGLVLLLFIAIQKIAQSRIAKRRVQRKLLKWAIRLGYTG
jgi:hypothetical protein